MITQQWITQTGKRAYCGSKIKIPEFYNCGICGHWHPIAWNGDCRDDDNRFTTHAIEANHGNEGDGWREVEMPS